MPKRADLADEEEKDEPLPSDDEPSADEADDAEPPVFVAAGRRPVSMCKGACARCGEAYYCGKKCQVAHWKAGHSKTCMAKKKEGEEEA